MDLPQFGFVEDLDEGERLLVAGGGVDHIDVFGTATDQRGDGHDLGTQLLHYAKVEAQLIAVALACMVEVGAMVCTYDFSDSQASNSTTRRPSMEGPLMDG